MLKCNKMASHEKANKISHRHELRGTYKYKRLKMLA